jgi:hypothetical protein
LPRWGHTQVVHIIKQKRKGRVSVPPDELIEWHLSAEHRLARLREPRESRSHDRVRQRHRGQHVRRVDTLSRQVVARGEYRVSGGFLAVHVGEEPRDDDTA